MPVYKAKATKVKELPKKDGKAIEAKKMVKAEPTVVTVPKIAKTDAKKKEVSSGKKLKIAGKANKRF